MKTATYSIKLVITTWKMPTLLTTENSLKLYNILFIKSYIRVAPPRISPELAPTNMRWHMDT